MSAELTRKKHVRGGHRSSTTKMVSRAGELLGADTPDVVRLSQLKLSLQEKLDVLKQLDGEILGLVEEGSVAEEIEQADRFKEEIYGIMVRIDRLSVPPVTSPPSSPPSRAPVAELVPHSSRGGSRVKLPKLSIPHFNGELTAWTPFWDSYKAAIHDNPDLTDVDKFNYLRSLLEGPALEAISGLTLTSANYQEAISILEKWFGNKRQIVAKHMDTLINVDAVTSQYNLKGLRRLYDFVESHVRSLKSLGVAADSYGGLLASVLLNKLPQELQLIVSRKIGGDDWKLDVLMGIMEEEIRARERMTPTCMSTPTPRKANKEQTTAAALFTGNTGGPICCYCRQPHTSNSCGVITQPDARKRALQKSGRCFVCLRRGHISRECRSNMKCSKCNGRHHVSICSKSTDAQPQQNHTSATTHTRTEAPVTTTRQSQANLPAIRHSGLNPEAPVYQSHDPRSTSLWVTSNRMVLLQTAQTMAFNPDSPQLSRRVRIVLDSGSQRSYVTEQVARELSLMPEGEQPVIIMTFGASEEHPQVCKLVRLSLALKGGRTKHLTLFTVPFICEPLACQPVSFCQENFDHLAGLDLADPSDGRSPLAIDILIGSDQYWELITGETRRGNSGPVAIHTELGWVLSGPAASPTQDLPSACLVTHTLQIESLPQDTQALDDQLKSFWELESFGVSGSDHSVYDDFRSTVRLKDGRYEVELPWKDPHPTLPDNYQLCLRRLYGLVRRLKQDPDVLHEYDSIIHDQIQQGIVETTESSEEAKEDERIHYLPHHAVVRRDKETTKVRVVYDALARSDGLSLNDCLHAGPKFEQKIMDILLRFRVHRIAVTADIEKAFLMVSVAAKDRDVLRFLWFDDVFADQSDVVELRFTRVVFGVSSSPFLLNATIRHHLEQYNQTQPDLVHKLSKSIYVDDIVTGADSEEQAYQVFNESKGMLKDGGFNLQKFCSNSASLQGRVDKDNVTPAPRHRAGGPSLTEGSEETYTSSTLGRGQKIHLGEQKVLGVRWNVELDHFVINLDDIATAARELQPTKRNIVSLVGKFYDPLGFLAPVVIQFKTFFKELCAAKLEWDQPIPSELLRKWRSLRTGLEEAQPISIPRCYLDGVSDPLVSCTLCGFCDASLKAYAAMVYLLLETKNGCAVRFVAAKTRVSPLKEQTIPQLELLSALLLSRLLTSVTQSLEDELTLSVPRCFSDSEVALYWIKGTDRVWKPFVQNRVKEIRNLVPPELWRHCSGRDNPADIPSRGLAPLELSVNTLWRNGPNWLPEAKDGEADDNQEIPDECLSEIKAKDRTRVQGLLTTDSTIGLRNIFNCEDFSSIDRLLRVTALVLKFCRLLRTKTCPDAAASVHDDDVNAEERWISECQRGLVTDKKFKYWQKQFELFQDKNGLWRCGGRIQNAAVPYSTKHPILLPKGHHLTLLFVRKAHERVLHNGVKETLMELWSQFWIVKGRSFVKHVLHQCQVCRRHEGKPYNTPQPPPLPSFRVEEAPPFSFTGVDFAGPLYIKSVDGTQKVPIHLLCSEGSSFGACS